MIKNILSILLLVVFTNFIVAPTIISLVDTTADIFSVFSLNEEDKKESLEIKEIELVNYTDKGIISHNLAMEITFAYFFKNYDSLSIQLPLPPPEQKTV